MNWFQSFRLSIRALRANPLRSGLTALGIVLGVAAVICMVAVGEGARSKISQAIAKFGTELLFVQPYSWVPGMRHAVTEDDAAALRHDIPGVQISAPVVWGIAKIITGNKHTKTTVWGINSDYLRAHEWQLAAGRPFIREEMASGAKVTILGQFVADKLFNGTPRVGATVRIDKIPFTVIGILARRGNNASGKNQDDLALVPLRTARIRLFGSSMENKPKDGLGLLGSEKKPAQTMKYPHDANFEALDYLVVKYNQSFSTKEMKREIRKVLLRRGHSPSDFGIFDPTVALEAQESSARTFGWLLAGIASIALAVGGLSIMNTMLVSVTERTREIGLRMAVGARRRDIRNQFLFEAVVLAICGAVGGTLLGVVGAAGIARFGGWPVLISPAVVLLACGFTSLVGVVFGLLPAIKASRLDPMVALRFE